MADTIRHIMQKRITKLRHYYNAIKNDDNTPRETKRDIFNRLHELEEVMQEAYGSAL